jgi:hypothetical protein
MPCNQPFEYTLNIDWPMVLKIWRATGRWNTAYGGEPGTDSYKGPK